MDGSHPGGGGAQSPVIVQCVWHGSVLVLVIVGAAWVAEVKARAAKSARLKMMVCILFACLCVCKDAAVRLLVRLF